MEIYQHELIISACNKEENIDVEIAKIDTNNIVLIFSSKIKYKEYITQIITFIYKEFVRYINFTFSVGVGSVYSNYKRKQPNNIS